MKKLITFFSLVLYLVISSLFLFSDGVFAQSDLQEPVKRDPSKWKVSKDLSGQKTVSNPGLDNINIIINVPGDQPTIQAAISAANNGDIISVAPGTYREDLTLNKFVHIRGANFGINPNTGIRGPETVIQPFSSDPDPNSLTAVTILYIGSNGSGSTIDGLTFDGDNTIITSGVIINGADIDAIEAVSAYDGLSNTTFSNNIVRNTSYSGIDFYNFSNGGASTYDNIITGNKFDNIDPAQYGIGVLIYNNCYSSITYNVMTRVRVGVQTGNFYNADLGTNHSISNNTIESYRLGIFHNLTYLNATTFTISNNEFTTLSGSPNNNGIELSSIGGAVSVIVTDNNVTGARAGYNLWNCTTSNTVTVTGGILTNCSVGVFANNYDGYNSNAGSSIYSMTGITMNNCDTAIWIRDNNLNTNNATVALHINNTTNTVTGTGIGLLIEGGDASVNFNGAVPVNFSTSLSKYIRLITNGSNVPAAIINAQTVQFGGTSGAGLTNSQLFAVEDKIDHKPDWSALGFVSVKAFNDFITVNSFYPPNTSSALIQNGIDAAAAGDTANIGPGTFNGNVILNKAITLSGNGPSSTIISPLVSCTGDGINITSSNANVKDLKVTDFNYGIRTSTSAVSLYNVECVSNCQYGLNTNNGTNGLTIIRCKLNSNAVGGWRAGTGDLVSNVMIDSSEVNGNGSGGNGFGIFVAAQTPGINTFDYITIKNSDFSNNLQKGMYFEKLRHALIDNVLINNSGTDPAYGFNTGIDMNLKYDSYTDIIIQNSSVTNCGSMGTATDINNPSALAIKARDDSPSYNSDPATLTGFVLKNSFVSGPVNGLRFGEFNKNNASPTGNTVFENNFGNSYSNKAILNKTSNIVTVSCNWYGSATPSNVNALNGSNVNFIPFLTNGTDDNLLAAGFQPVPGSCDGVGPVKNVTQNITYPTIQQAVDAANTGDVIEIDPGTYNEQVLVNKEVTIKNSGAKPVINFIGTPSLVSGKLTAFEITVPNVKIESLDFEIDLAKLGSAIIASASNINNLTIKNNDINPYKSGTLLSFSLRNAVNINYATYRINSSNPSNILAENNNITYNFYGTPLDPSDDAGFRGGFMTDEGGGTFTGNTIQTISQDIEARFGGAGDINVTGNNINGGGVNLSEYNAGAGNINVTGNIFDGTFANAYSSSLRLKNNQVIKTTVVSGNTFQNHNWGISMENYRAVTLNNNTFTPLANSTVFRHITVNTKLLASSSATVVQTAIDATFTNNTFNGSGTPGGTGMAFYNHDSDNDSYGTFTLGSTANENNFNYGMDKFILLDSSSGPSWPSAFPENNLGAPAVTTMACWDQNIDVSHNKFDVGSGLELPASMNFTNRNLLEVSLFHKPDNSCTGTLFYFMPVHNLTQNTYYMTIQSAINASNPSDVIECSEYTYNERVTIDKTLTLQGVDKTNCVITGTGLSGNGKGIQINNSVTGVTIKHFTIQNFAGSNGNTDGGIYSIGGNNNLLIRGVVLQNNVGGSGFYANGPVNTVTLDSVTSSGHNSNARGIVIWNGLKENITITNCEVFGNNCCGVELQDGTASGVTITNNNVHDNFDNGIGLVGLQGPGENLIKSNTLLNNGRFGIEIKNPNGSGLATGAGRIVVENNNVSRTAAIVDNRDIAGIAAFRRGVLAGNVDIPTGVVIQNNIVSGYTQTSVSEGFGIVVEGLNHTVSGNTVSGCDVGIQRQAGHLPYPGDGDQSNVADTYFGRGNSPQTCEVTESGNILTNTIDTRDVGAGTGSGIVKNNNTNETFCSIQAAIDDPQTLNGHTINVDTGYFNESVIINKQVTIIGNGGAPNSRPVVEGVSGQTFSVTVPNVTISNLTIKFNQGSVNTGVRAAASGSFNNLTIKRSCIFGTGTTGAAIFGSYGLQLGSFGGVLYDQVNLDSNEIKETGTSPLGRGVRTYNCYGDWKNSSIKGFYTFQAGDNQGGILNITKDTLNGEAELNNFGAGAHSFTNNICNVSNAFGPGTDFALLELKNISLGSASLDISGNTFSGYVNFGIFSSRSNNITINNNVFTPDPTALNFRSLRIDTKQRTTVVQTAFASGAVITNNTFNGNAAVGQTGISFELANSDNVSSFGIISLGTLGNENDFNTGVKKFISLNNETTSTSGDPTWTGTYISTKAKVSLNLDGTNNSYYAGAGFELPSGMSLANLFLLEDKIQHKIDDSGLGFIKVKANNDYVTVNSFVTPATTAASIQRGIDASSASWTVNVNDGTYNEDIDINKAISVTGYSAAAIVRGLYAGNVNTVLMSSSNSLISNVTVTRDYGANLAAWNASGKNQGINVAQTTTGITINKVTLTGNRNAIFVNNAQTVTISQCMIEDNRTGIHFGNNFSGAEVHNNFIRNNFTHGVLFNYDLTTGIVATNVHVNNNSITGNWYSQVDFQRNSGPAPTGDHTGLTFNCNWYGTTMPSAVAANAAEPGYTSQVPSQFGGSDPGLNRQLYGIEIARCPYMPWLTNGTDNYLDTAGFQPVPGSCNGLQSKLYVNDNSLTGDVFTSAVGNNSNLGTPGAPFETISYAVSVASPGDTIYVDAGTYQEQVNINKTLSIIGADSAGVHAAIIKAPAVLSTVSNANASDHTPIVYASGADTVNISHVCVDGDGRGGAKFSGVYYFESNGSFSHSKITKVRDVTFSGVQSGNAFFANHTYDVSYDQKVTVSDNVIDDYQKTGILINELNTHGILTNNIVTGQSIQHVNGQNGIQFGYGAYGTITGNTVTGNQYNGPANDDASGILLAGAGVNASNVSTGQTTTIGGAGALANIMTGNEAGLLTDGGGFGYNSNSGVIYNANNFANNYIHASENSPNTIPSVSNTYDKRIDNTSQTNIVYGQIQRSVDDASGGNVLNVSANTFTEQVEIHKNITLAGQGSGMTNIVSPNTLLLSYTTTNVNKPIIFVHDTSDVIIKNLTVDGAGKGNANYRFQGIAYWNSGGTVRNCEIKDVRETPLNGNQHGVALYVFATDGNARSLNVIKNTMTGFQKNATVFSGADLTAVIDSNIVTGAGPTNVTAQNGIQLSNSAKGSVSCNTLSGFSFTPASFLACAILVSQPGASVTTSNNIISASQMGIYYYQIGGTISGNIINATAASVGINDYWAIDADPGADPHLKIQPFDSESSFGLRKGNTLNSMSTFTTLIKRNTLTSDGTHGTAIEMDALGTDVLNATATENNVHGWDAGVVFYKTGGATLNGIVNYNDLSGNTYALYDFTGVTQNAQCNWYGTTDNMLISPTVSGSVNYIPYLSNGADNYPDTAGFQAVPGSCNGIPASVIIIKVIPEGFYNANQQLNIKDTVKAYLHSNITPYNVIDSAKSTIDSVTFTGSFTFIQPSGTYYIVIKHRNTIETWSKTGGEAFTAGTTMNYDFTNLASKAFGNNMKQVDNSPVRFAIYSGDVNQDGIVESADQTIIDNNSFNYVTGYVPADLNGDGIVDINDASIADNNVFNYVQTVRP